MRTVTLKYHREGDSLLSTGTITVGGAEPFAFGSEGFSRMMRLVHMQLEPGDQLVIWRDDRPGLLPVTMEPTFTELLRTDPVAAIKSMTYVPDHVVQKPIGRKPLPAQKPVDPMTDGYHGVVHYRRRDQDIECPVCGMWSAVYEADRVFICRKKCLSLFHLRELSAELATFNIEELLRQPFDRFYITEKWNPNGPWMVRHDLERLNLAWQQIKDSQ